MLIYGGSVDAGLRAALFTVVSVNVSLAFFNLIPIPPFDGMGILEAIFPRLTIRSRHVYNPFFMIGAILVASVLYGMFMPHILQGIVGLLL